MQSSVDFRPINIRNENGFSLIELSLVILLIGLFIGASVPLYKIYIQRNAVIITEKRMDTVARGFSNYVQMRFRLPCPADPASPAGTQFGVERATCTSEADARGIVPYRTLGIPEEYAKDRYGNFFTYIVSPDFTADTQLGTSDLVNQRLAHLVAGSKFALLPIAQFCAPLANTGTDITVQQDGADLFTSAGRDNTNVTRSTTDTPDANLNRINATTAIAMSLISHGANGFGAYRADGSQITGPSGASEAITNAIDRIVQLQRGVTNDGVNQYDDIIKFYTQDEIYTLSGGGSCENL